eukprot:gnl/MRDRNA2_/MRDRNA2_84329_c0_seq1.p1 gnl/MRDRNA2_/MRDRNA2_84329_c0~~gnl/MRDRNA2_/MRDRNA2_84329_c0_seq1.p1  ORF type:complete len:539 (+),score=112.12 gnl/MRDRNA2_/MRDRNA2_84329_c0_seq1:60-1676(+)
MVLDQGKGGAGEVPPIDEKTQRRIANVLSHLAGSKKPEGQAERNCRTCLHAKTCKSPGDDCTPQKMVDIEDLQSLNKRPSQAGNNGFPKPKAYAKRTYSGDFFDDDADTLFDNARFADTQKPLLQAFTLPPEVYSSRRWFERELLEVFMPSWSLIGREDEIIDPGQYIALDTDWAGPVAVCRGNDGKLYAFANVCCHRGAKVLPDGKGKGTALGLVCPYHAWTYEFDGTLKWAPGMHKTEHFNEDEVRLTPVRLETFHGFIFVTASEKTKPLHEAMGDLPDKLEPWFGANGAVKNMVCVSRYETEVGCNWKFLMENTCETYHTSVVHNASLGPMKSKPMDPHVGDWDAVQVPSERSIVPLPDDFKGVRFPLPAFTDKTAFVNMFPSLQVNVTWDCIWWMYLIPSAPEKTKIQMGFCFPRETVQLPQFSSTLERYLHRWRTAVAEDNEISLNQQRGVRSVFRTPGRFCQLEFGTHNFNNWLLCRMLDGQKGRWDPGQRVFTGAGEMFSNDSRDMVALAEASEQQAKSVSAENTFRRAAF